MVTLLNQEWSLLNVVLLVLFCADLQSRFNYQIWSLREFNDMLFAFFANKKHLFFGNIIFYNNHYSCIFRRKWSLWSKEWHFENWTVAEKKALIKPFFFYMSLVCLSVFVPTQSTILPIYCNLSWCFIAIFGSPLLLPSSDRCMGRLDRAARTKINKFQQFIVGKR